MSLKKYSGKFWEFINNDTWLSFFILIVIIIIAIKFVLFPILEFTTGSGLPLVVVESCSMYHEVSFNNWWNKNSGWYESENITKSDFEDYSFNNGLNKGDIIIVWGKSSYKKGDIIIFNSETQYPIIHRIISLNPVSTKGDHNPGQLSIEKDIDKKAIVGKAIGRIPYLGWIKLIFYEFSKDQSQRGLCQ